VISDILVLKFGFHIQLVPLQHGDKTPAQVAVNYCMSKGTVPIPGAKDAKQAASVVGCLGWRLEEAEVQALELAARAVPASPGAPFEAW
jgi:aryl-alcohol dehydrogenase-like predicted oxidoreductase